MSQKKLIRTRRMFDAPTAFCAGETEMSNAEDIEERESEERVESIARVAKTMMSTEREDS